MKPLTRSDELHVTERSRPRNAELRSAVVAQLRLERHRPGLCRRRQRQKELRDLEAGERSARPRRRVARDVLVPSVRGVRVLDLEPLLDLHHEARHGRLALVRDVKRDEVAVTDRGQRTTGGCLGGDVEHDGAKGGAAHAGVGDADHVADAVAQEFLGNGNHAGLGHAGSANRAGVLQDQYVVWSNIERGIVNPAGQILDRGEDDRAAAVDEQVRRRGGMLDDGSVGGEVATQHREATLGMDRVFR